jgi:hypothetical protein
MATPAQAQGGSVGIPDPTALSKALAESDDWRAIVIVLIVVIAMQFAFIIWRELNLVRLIKGLDKVSDGLWGIRLSMARGISLAAHETEEAHKEA